MLQTKLINREGIRVFKQVSKTTNDDRLDDIIIQVQITELAPLLGDKLFNALLNNPAGYTTLLNGGTYIVDEITHTNYGLKAVLAFYFDAYWKMFGDVTSTPFGNVTKLNGGLSEPVTDAFKKSMFTINKQSAFIIWQNVEHFLIRTKEPLFMTNCVVRNSGFRINKIR